MDAFAAMEDMVAALKGGEISASELIGMHLERIEKLDRTLHSFIEVLGEPAMASARFGDQRGLLPSPERPLQGIPVAIKDVFDHEGTITRAGSLATPERPAARTAPSVKSLESAGAVIHGKTHTVEFTFGGWGTNPVMGTPWNPWDLDTHRVPGGSSSGSAVAVAAGLAAASLGTDTGGSIRTPASYCGIVGVKTSPGLISRQGVFPLCPTHDSVAVMTRHVRDAAMLLEVLAGLDCLSDIERGVAGLRLGIVPDAELAKAEGAVIDLIEATAKDLTSEGATIVAFEPPRALESYLRAAGDIMSAESVRHLAPLIDAQPAKVDPVVAERVLRGKNIGAAAYLALLDERNTARVEFDQRMDRLDAVLAPTCLEGAIPVSEVDENRIVTPYGRFVNYLDMAAISVPIGLVGPGLPVGIQIAVRRGDDRLALRIARAVERLRGSFRPHLRRLAG
jgi:aspartyl-tRNA(Asn)/glutamyl-tRNA(Gln) amidotransferase subunit A